MPEVKDLIKCGNCSKFSYCSKMVGAEADWKKCDWDPSRFSPSVEVLEKSGRLDKTVAWMEGHEIENIPEPAQSVFKDILEMLKGGEHENNLSA